MASSSASLCSLRGVPNPPGQPVFDCVVELNEVVPRVWRRLLVPGSVRLGKLHRILQAAMGWEDSHLHAFDIADRRYGLLLDEHPDDELDEASVTVVTALGDATTFTYTYDFGDGWKHHVAVGTAWRMPIGLKFAVCLDGANACPPEDCGGPAGYEDLLQVLADPSHEDHADLLEWAGGPIDLTHFDIGLVNARLQAVR